MKNNKLIETLSLTALVFLSLHFFIFPGLASNNVFVNVISLTSFVLLIVLVVFGGIFTGTNENE